MLSSSTSLSRRLLSTTSQTRLLQRAFSLHISTQLPRVRPSKGSHAHEQSLLDPAKFWDHEAQKRVSWFTPYRSILSVDAKTGYGKWFSGGTMNTCYNCLDRHIEAGLGDKAAIIYDSPVTNTVKTYTYNDLLDQVVRLSNHMRSQGLSKGDRVIIYMPNIPEAAMAMLACARLGVIHSVVFGGFAANELATRIKDCKPKMIISASCGIDGQKVIDYKTLLDHSLELCEEEHKVDSTLIFQRPQHVAPLKEGFDHDWSDSLAKASVIDKSCEEVDANDPLYILYTSGTTGQPKGVVRDNGGHAVSLQWALDNVYGMKQNDIFWAASDVGWVVGHSFIVYGPLLYGMTSVFYEGKPIGTPDASNYFRTIQRHKVNGMFTAPTALRAIKRLDEKGELASKFDISTLRTLFLAGERADPDTLKWAESSLKVPVRDHWWQTETGFPITGNLVGLEGYLPVKYGSSFRPCAGFDVHILNDEHELVAANHLGRIAIKLPLPPGCLSTLFNNHDRFVKSYLTEVVGYYDTGDAGYIDEDGYVYIMSRTDDVINVAGHRLSSGAMEEVISDHPDVAEVAVVGKKDDFKGQIPLGLMVLNAKLTRSHDEIVKEVLHMVRERIGPVASFKDAIIVDKLPKTRSGKVLRATLRSIANGDEYKIPATIEDPQVLTDVGHLITSYHHK